MKRKYIIGIALFLIVIIGLLSLFTFFQKHKKAQKKSLQDQIKCKSALQTLEKEKKNLNSLAGNLGINYFSRFPESAQMDISFFMFNRVSSLANKCSVQLISFSPAEKEEKGKFTKISFIGEINATFPEMVNFFSKLEDEEKLSLDNLKVTTSSQSPLEHRAHFALGCLELEDTLLQNLGKGETILSSSYYQDKIKTLGRDPFANLMKPSEVSLPRGPEAASLRVEKDREGYIDLSGALSLTGITSLKNSRTAIIDHKIVKEGEQIDGKQVITIKEDSVILKAGEQLYILRLKETSPSKKVEENPLTLEGEQE